MEPLWLSTLNRVRITFTFNINAMFVMQISDLLRLFTALKEDKIALARSREHMTLYMLM